MRSFMTGVLLAVTALVFAPATYAQTAPDAPAQAASEGPAPPLGADPVYPAQKQAEQAPTQPVSTPAAPPAAPAKPAVAQGDGQPTTADQQTYRMKDGGMYQPPARRPASPAADTSHYGRT